MVALMFSKYGLVGVRMQLPCHLVELSRHYKIHCIVHHWCLKAVACTSNCLVKDLHIEAHLSLCLSSEMCYTNKLDSHFRLQIY